MIQVYQVTVERDGLHETFYFTSHWEAERFKVQMWNRAWRTVNVTRQPLYDADTAAHLAEAHYAEWQPMKAAT